MCQAIVLPDASQDVHDYVTTKVGIEKWIYALKLAILDVLSNLEGIGVVTGYKTDTEDKSERTNHGSCVDQDVVKKEQQ